MLPLVWRVRGLAIFLPSLFLGTRRGVDESLGTHTFRVGLGGYFLKRR